MARVIATVSGTALRPGVSRNGRYYSAEMIERAVARAQDRVGSGDMRFTDLEPLTQRTHHGSEDDSTRIVGRVTSLRVAEDGSARFTADLADTPHGRTISTLIDPEGGPPFLKGVSIRGAWLGNVRKEMVGGDLVETADDLELSGLDYTSNPGVIGAVIDSVTRPGATRESVLSRTPIFESVQEAHVTITEAGPGDHMAPGCDGNCCDACGVNTTTESSPDGTVAEKGAPALKSGKAAAPQTKAQKYADPGYQDDKSPRYALDTMKQAKAAWSYINMPKNAADYTAAQLKRVKARIIKALRGFGVKVDAKESWVITPAVTVAESVTEAMGDIWPDVPGSFAVEICNGMVDIRVSSYRVDPADLEVVARAAMEGACQALAALDPDMDGDIDTPGSDDEATESADQPDTAVDETEPETPPQTPAPDAGAVSTTEQEPDVSEPTTPAAETPAATPATPSDNAPAPAGVTLTDEQFQQLLSRLTPPAPPAQQLVGAGAPAESAPAPATVTETAQTPPAATPAPVTETAEQRDQRIAEAAVRAFVATQAEAGNVGRKGLTVNTAAGVRESADGSVLPDGVPDKPFHELNPQAWRKVRNQVGAEVAGIELP